MPQFIDDLLATYLKNQITGIDAGRVKLALQEANNPSRLIVVPHPGQGRAIQLLKEADVYDVIWTGESLGRDEALLKIDFPLFSGGLGIRGSIIKKSFVTQFNSINNISDLKGYIACQGRHWPDADILEKSGIEVFRVSRFDGTSAIHHSSSEGSSPEF